MPQVVFLRGVNVGGHRRFSPAGLARDLAHFDVVNIGAAGTFVVRSRIAQAALRAEIAGRLPFETELIICRDREVLDLVAANPFAAHPDHPGNRCVVTVLAKAPAAAGALLRYPDDAETWEAQSIGVRGRFVLAVYRRLTPRVINVNQLLEKRYGVAGTTRNWNTIQAIARLLA